MSDIAREQVGGVVATKVNQYTASDVFEEWDLAELETQLGTICGSRSSCPSSIRRRRARRRSPSS